MFKNVRFLEKSNVSRKLRGFNSSDLETEGDSVTVNSHSLEDYENSINKDIPISKHVSCMSLVESFMTQSTYSEI